MSVPVLSGFLEGSVNFTAKSQMVNSLGFAAHMASVIRVCFTTL